LPFYFIVDLILMKQKETVNKKEACEKPLFKDVFNIAG